MPNMTVLLFVAQRATAAVLAFAVTVHLATIVYAVRGGLTGPRSSRARNTMAGSSPSTPCS